VPLVAWSSSVAMAGMALGGRRGKRELSGDVNVNIESDLSSLLERTLN